MKIIKLIGGILAVCFISFTHADYNSDTGSLIEIVKQYYKTLEGVRQESSSEADVEKLLSLLSDDFRYEHPRFGADGDKKEMRDGLIYVLGKQRNSSIKIENYIEGLDAVFVKIESGAEVKRDSEWKLSSGPETALFEIKDGKILRIHEYW